MHTDYSYRRRLIFAHENIQISLSANQSLIKIMKSAEKSEINFLSTFLDTNSRELHEIGSERWSHSIVSAVMSCLFSKEVQFNGC